MGENEDERSSQATQLFETFVRASTCKGTLQAFSLLCRQLELDPTNHGGFYSSLKAAITSWKAKALWTKLDKRASHKEYKKGKACPDLRCLIIGAGPCGLRTAIELALLGAKVKVIEKRDTFSRNNVLHLWPYTIHDLRNLGAKKFYGKFCAGAIDHISIRQLQLILLKVSLILGVEVHVNVEFHKLLEPPEEQDRDGTGWRAELRPLGHPISDFEFDVLIASDGRRSTLDGFKRKEFRGKLAIAITANFVNRNTTAEAKVEEISGVAFIFNQKFFLELKEETGIDLENIVYYKDNTHYFVMTAKKQSLLEKGVIKHDYIETERLLHSDNVDQEALLSYAREAADFGTNYQLPSLDYAINHYGQPDVAMFDFTCMYASENAALIREKNGQPLLVALVGDSLLEPFWPMGTGCARGFLAAFDTAWMVQGWVQGKAPVDVLSERESIYRLLPQTTAENITKNFEQYTIDPATRYPNLNSACVRPHQVRHLYINGEQDSGSLEHGGPTRRSVNISRRESEVRPSRLLLWCQKQTQGYRGVNVTDLTTSWRSGLALCALIHRHRPDLIDFDSLNEADSAKNNQLAFEVAEKALGIQPLITGKEMAAEQEPDKLIMVLYLSKFYEMFCNSSLPPLGAQKETTKNNDGYLSKPNNSIYNFINSTQPRKRIPKDDKKSDIDNDKKRRKAFSYLEELSCQGGLSTEENGEHKENKVRSMATRLQAKFEENAPSSTLRRQSETESDSSSAEKPLSLDMTENPRFAKPTVQPPPPPKPKWQPSPYLRLLESQIQPGHKHVRDDVQLPHQHTQVHSAYSQTADHPADQMSEAHFTLHFTKTQSHTQASKPQSTSQSPSRASEPRTSSACLSVSATQLVTLSHVLQTSQPSDTSSSPEPLLSSTFALGGMLQRLQILEEQITQRRAQTVSAGEFSRKSIRERAEQLSFLFSGKVPQADRSCPAAVKPLSSPSVPEHSTLSCVLSPLPSDQHKQGNPRKEFASGMGGSDTCHFCKKRVYVMERLSAEGYFFHRECFRCDVCSATLRLGGHVFDQGKFYCKLHFSQRKTRLRKQEVHRGHVSMPDSTDGYSSTSSLNRHASEALEVCASNKTENNHIQNGLVDCESMSESSADPRLSDLPDLISNRVCDSAVQNPPRESLPPTSTQLSKALPPILVKTYTTDQAAGGDPAPAEEEENSDFEEIDAPEPVTTPNTQDSDSHCPPQDKPEKPDLVDFPLYRTHGIKSSLKPSTASTEERPDDQTSVSSKKKLTLSSLEKERLLNWDLATPGHFSATAKAVDQVLKHSQSNGTPEHLSKPQKKPEAHLEQRSIPTEADNSASLSNFQVLTSFMRRSFTGTTDKPKVIRRDLPLRARPLSEGSFSFASVYNGAESGEQEQMRSRAATGESRTRRSEITAMLEQVTISNRPSGASKDDMASLPPRKLNFFSSMRLKRKEGADKVKTDNQEKDIWTVLSKLRSKGSSQQQLEDEDYSSSEEDQESNFFRSNAERRRKQQEKTLVLQTKRDQLKRLHRAQMIQRQLEEVEEKQRVLEERGVVLEKVLRGETEDKSEDEGGALLQTWFKLVLEKNKLARYESELMIFAKELELEDRQSRLQQDLRRQMASKDYKKNSGDTVEEQTLLAEVMKVVEERDQLVSLLEEQRLQEKAEDHDLESLILSKGYQFHWT
ncbi:F-actin-monooxygenase mical2b isoform X2 [Trichomycterus rosablanca]|uniref:F-actin-monooxygenase mical2b isoform X2 n=1 Tax=Trichomycterus rosablanca TaxID=2290929 RepID=UPI002F34F3AB